MRCRPMSFAPATGRRVKRRSPSELTVQVFAPSAPMIPDTAFTHIRNRAWFK
jgi:hypothetical protein